jgi:lipoprotein-anchoring transpeptidase ErfK/SrfK
MARPRYQRITAVAGATGITLVTVLAGIGLLPGGSSGRTAYAVQRAAGPQTPTTQGAITLSGSTVDRPPEESTTPGTTLPRTTLPEDSGHGRRIVFDISDQRVWLVEEDGVVRRTYPVSGSLSGNLRPGSYAVYSRSRHAVGVDDSGTMQYMVRFAHGSHAAIGFHDIPVDDGQPVQTRADLGTPQSHGCIRQWRPDALALWRFAPVGTEVVVTA